MIIPDRSSLKQFIYNQLELYNTAQMQYNLSKGRSKVRSEENQKVIINEIKSNIIRSFNKVTREDYIDEIINIVQD